MKTLTDFVNENARSHAAMPAPLREVAAGLDAGQRFLDAVGLTCRPVVDYEDVEWLRIIRNTCRAGFASDNAVITPRQQEAWWQANQQRLVAYLYQDSDGFVVGYGLLRMTDDGRWWSSVATLPAYTGRGYGGAVTAHIVRHSPTGVVYAQARKDNPSACRLHHIRDWEVTSEDARLFHYRTREDLA